MAQEICISGRVCVAVGIISDLIGFKKGFFQLWTFWRNSGCPQWERWSKWSSVGVSGLPKLYLSLNEL